MSESDAKAALRAMGIFAPSRSLVQNWLRAANADPYVQDERRPIEAAPAQPNTTAERKGTVADLPISSVDLDAAIRALEAQGIPTTHQAVLDWLAQHRLARVAPAPPQQRPSTEQNKPEQPPSPQKGVSKLVPSRS